MKRVLGQETAGLRRSKGSGESASPGKQIAKQTKRKKGPSLRTKPKKAENPAFLSTEGRKEISNCYFCRSFKETQFFDNL